VNGKPAKITVFGRPDCHLCDEAVQMIHAVEAEGILLALEVIDIESDDELMKRYLERIPVVTLEGDVVSELVFDPASLRARLGIT